MLSVVVWTCPLRNLLPSSQNNDFACHARRALLGIGRVEQSRTSIYPRVHLPAFPSRCSFACPPPPSFRRLCHGWRAVVPYADDPHAGLGVERMRGGAFPAAASAGVTPLASHRSIARPKPRRRTPPLGGRLPRCRARRRSGAEVARSTCLGGPVSL